MLLKYEFRKTRPAKLILGGITLALEILFLIGVIFKKDAAVAWGTALLTVTAFIGIVVIGIQSIETLHRDMSTKQSALLFMTPNSCYRILGAKVLECALSIFAVGAAFFALGVLDLNLLFSRFGSIQELVEMATSFLHSLNEHIHLNAAEIGSLLFAVAAGWLCTVISAMLADVVGVALLPGKKGSGFICLLLFIVLELVSGWLIGLIPEPSGTAASLLVNGAAQLAVAAVMYWGAARIMESKLSV